MRPNSSLSRLKQQYQNLGLHSVKSNKTQQELPTKEELIKKKDFSNAIILLEEDKILYKENYTHQMWLAYCYYHNGDLDKSLNIYTYWSTKQNCDPILFTYKACCLYSLGKYKEAYDEADLGLKDDELTNRLKFHCAFKLKIGVAVIDYHLKLTKSTADKLSLAAHQYLKGEYEEATQIYKNIYYDKKYDAINVYLAMCYFKLELYDIALDLVNHYLTNHKSSVIAVNLKAAIEYQSSGNCKAAQNIILTLKEHTKSENFLEKDDLLLHNMTVFDNDEWNSNSKKLKVFRQLVDVLPESKLNLIIYYLKNDSVVQAYNLIKDMQPNTTKEYILKAIVHCLLGQQSDKNQDNLKKAKTYFQNVGASNVECDTIEGRQCMAACLRLIGLFNEEIIYLESIEVFMKDDDIFNWNYGIALASCQKYKEAEEVFLRVTKEKYKTDPIYLSWLCRCYIMNDKPELAWTMYISSDHSMIAFKILSFIAHEFYRMGYYYFAFKSFLHLEKFSPSVENGNAKIASASGVFLKLASGKDNDYEKLQDVINGLADSVSSTYQSEEVLKMIKTFMKWGNEKGYNFTDNIY